MNLAWNDKRSLPVGAGGKNWVKSWFGSFWERNSHELSHFLGVFYGVRTYEKLSIVIFCIISSHYFRMWWLYEEKGFVALSM